jgi:uncharacterized protein with von Willebrand factor type A (vWA) domain
MPDVNNYDTHGAEQSGYLSPAEVEQKVKMVRAEYEGWKSPEDYSKTIDIMTQTGIEAARHARAEEKAIHAKAIDLLGIAAENRRKGDVQQARESALREVGEWLRKKLAEGEVVYVARMTTAKVIHPLDLQLTIKALSSGQMPIQAALALADKVQGKE